CDRRGRSNTGPVDGQTLNNQLSHKLGRGGGGGGGGYEEEQERRGVTENVRFLWGTRPRTTAVHSEVIHTQGPLDGSLYAKVRKKESAEGSVTANDLPPTAADHALPAATTPSRLSSDSGNSTASNQEQTGQMKLHSRHRPRPPPPPPQPLRTLRSPCRGAAPTAASHRHPGSQQQQQQPLSPQEQQELDQLLSGLEGPLHRQGYLAAPAAATAAGRMLHLVPAQVHVNGHHHNNPAAATAATTVTDSNTANSSNNMDRETDILDDDLPTSQEGNSSEVIVTNGQDHVPYLERSAPERPLESSAVQYGKAGAMTQSESVPSCSDSGEYPAGLNGGLYRSQSFGGEPKSMPRAPTRTTSSKDAVQRGLNVWQRFGVPEEPLTEGLSFSPPQASTASQGSLSYYPRHSASQQEIEQSIETLNLLMLDLDPGRPAVPKSQSAPLREASVVTTQPSFSQSQARPSYQADAAIHSRPAATASGPMAEAGAPHFSSTLDSSRGRPSEPTALQGYTTLPNRTALQLQTSGGGGGHFQLKPINNYPPSSVASAPAPERSPSAASPSSQPREAEADEVFNVEGLVAQRVAGVQSRRISFEDPTEASPRQRAPSDGGQFQNGPNADATSPEGPLRSPVRCVSPEFINAIAMNPGGRPKETPLSALGLKPHNPAEILLNQTGSAPQSYVESVARSASSSGEPPGPQGEAPQGPGSSQALNPPLSSSSPIQSTSQCPPSQPTTDSGYRSPPMESLRPTPTPFYQATATSPYQATPTSYQTTPTPSYQAMPTSSNYQAMPTPETRLNVKFVQDTSKFWYKPEISREQAIGLLKEREPGAFVIRDSHSFRGAYGLAMKVASPPPTVQPNKKAGDITNELVRHFLIESSPKGVKLKGCPNEPFFDLKEETLVVPVATNPLAERLKQGAACNVLYINSVDMESLTGPQAVAKAISETLAATTPPTATVVHFKVLAQGITLTDNQRKLFFRRHYPSNSVTFCDIDPQDRKWNKSEGGSAK
ncbi:LOW QUALITY PROTEIN: hypothetical protein CRUP_018875, partial [Coryphaenoides rupestris]